MYKLLICFLCSSTPIENGSGLGPKRLGLYLLKNKIDSKSCQVLFVVSLKILPPSKIVVVVVVVVVVIVVLLSLRGGNQSHLAHTLSIPSQGDQIIQECYLWLDSH